MVAQRFLVPFVGVRIPVSLPLFKPLEKSSFFLYTLKFEE